MPTQGIDFSTLTLKDALDLAVLVEEEARDRYDELAEQMTQFHTPAAGEFFSKMVRVEELHRVHLLKKRQAAFGDAPVTVRRAQLFDVEAPEYDQARAFMTIRQALGTAMAAEAKAQAFYAQAAKQARDEGIRALFAELAEEEVGHQKLVQEQLDRTAPDDPVKGDVSDDPVAL
jgi:erythrin-vacuolar iron transport family protein